jgi:hypothetical protein
MTQPFSMCASCFRSPMQDLPAHPTFLCINHILFVILRNLSPSLYSLLLCYNHCLQTCVRYSLMRMAVLGWRSGDRFTSAVLGGCWRCSWLRPRFQTSKSRRFVGLSLPTAPGGGASMNQYAQARILRAEDRGVVSGVVRQLLTQAVSMD